MTIHTLHPIEDAREPDLLAADIPWGRDGLSRYRIEVGDEVSYRVLAREALHALARVTAQLDRANATIVMLRDELRARRAA